MNPQQYIEAQQEAGIYILWHYGWLWLSLIAVAVALKWVYENYYDN